MDEDQKEEVSEMLSLPALKGSDVFLNVYLVNNTCIVWWANSRVKKDMQINYYLGQAAWNLPFTLETLTMSKPSRTIDPLCHQMPTNHQTNH